MPPPLSRVCLVMWPVMLCHAEHVKPGQDVTRGPGIVGYMCMRLCSRQHLQDFFISKAANHPTLAHISQDICDLDPNQASRLPLLFGSGSVVQKYQRKGRIPNLKRGVTPLATLDGARNASAGGSRDNPDRCWHHLGELFLCGRAAA